MNARVVFESGAKLPPNLVIPLDLRRVVVVAAFPPELSAFREALAEVETRAVGIGMVDAALGTARVIRELSPVLVIAIGTCGAFAPEDRAAIIVARETCLVDVGAVIAKTALPEVVASRASCTETFGASIELGVVATTLGITIDDEIAAKIAEKHAARAEHMEAFAVARACEQHGARCGVVLGVANVVGKNGRAEWRANHQAASQRAAKFVAEWLVKMSTTTPSPA